MALYVQYATTQNTQQFTAETRLGRPSFSRLGHPIQHHSGGLLQGMSGDSSTSEYIG